MSVLLIPNPTKDTGLAVTRQAAAVLAGLGVPVLMPQPFANEFGSAGLTGVHFLPEADAYAPAFWRPARSVSLRPSSNGWPRGSSPLPAAVCSTPKPRPTAGKLTPSMTLWCSVRPGCTRWIIRCTATAHWWAATAATA